MAEENNKAIRIECVIDNVSIDRNGIVTAKFKSPYGELGEWLKLFGVIAIDLLFWIKGEDEKKFIPTGKCRVKNVGADKEGECKIQLYGEKIDVKRLHELKEQVITLKIKLDPNQNGGDY